MLYLTYVFLPFSFFFFPLWRVSVLYCSLGLCQALPKTYCRPSLFLPLTFTSLNIQEKFWLAWYFIMHNIKKLPPVSTKIKYLIVEDNISKRGSTVMQTYTVKEMFRGTARGKMSAPFQSCPEEQLCCAHWTHALCPSFGKGKKWY